MAYSSEFLKSWFLLDKNSLAWRRRSHAAEADLPEEGRIYGVIKQLRQRGRSASFRANWMMVAVIVVVLAGLAYYIARPLWQDWVDGRAQTWEDRVQAGERENAELDMRREVLRRQLAVALAQTADVVRLANGEGLNNPLLLPDTNTLVVAGVRGTILRSADAGETWAEVRAPTGEELLTPLLLAGTSTLVATGTEGTILRLRDAGATWTEVRAATGEPLEAPLLLPGGTIVVTGGNGTILRSTDAGVTWTEVRAATGEWLTTPLLLPGTDTLVAIDEGGTILRSTDAGQTWTEVRAATGEGLFTQLLLPGTTTLVATGGRGTILRSADAGETWTEVRAAMGGWLSTPLLLPGTSTLVATGERGTILRSTNAGETWTEVHAATGEGLFTQLLLPGTTTLVVTGWRGTILRSADTGETWTEVRVATGEGFLTPLVLPGTSTLVATGGRGTILRSTDAGTTWIEVLGGSDEALSIPTQIPGTNTLFAIGDRGSILRSGDAGASWFAIRAATGEGLRGMLYIQEMNSLLMTGQNGTIILVSERLSRSIPAAPLAPLALGDKTLLDFIKLIEPSISAAGGVAPLLTEIESNPIRREIIDKYKNEALAKLDDLTSGVATLDERQEAFEAFMAGCRAGLAEDAEGSVTTACVAAYKVGEAAEVRNWWTVLAEQVPQGILLLFLLATLSGLYRYNVRLAGFHHSRADALELLVENVSIKDLTQLADALAADKVEFGAAKTPTDHAAEMATALINRAKP